jgi:hypothetical protein
MTQTTTLAENNATDAVADATNQAQVSRTYSQEEVDNMMARMRGSLEKKLLKPYEDLGDPQELRTLKQQAEAKAQSEAIKRGEFEKTLQELAARKDAEISKRDHIIKEYRVNTPVLNAAAKYRAVNPNQVQTLLTPSLRLNDDGEVEIVDAKGSVRYNDAGQPIGVDDLVREFLDSNPHFVSAAPATTNSSSSVGRNTVNNSVDLSKLDMKNPEHRKLYADARKSGRV